MADKNILSNENLSKGLEFDSTGKVSVKLNTSDKVLSLETDGSVKANLDLTFDTSTRKLTLSGKNSQEVASVDLDVLHYEKGNGINIDSANTISVDTTVISTKQNVTDEIAKLDKTDSEVTGQFVSSVSQDNGIITVTRKSLSKTDIPIIEQNQVNGLPSKITQCDNNKTAIDTLNGSDTVSGSVSYKIKQLAEGQVKTNTNAITKLNSDNTVIGSVDYKIKQLSDGSVASNTSAITILNSDETTTGSVKKTVKDASDAAVETLKKYADDKIKELNKSDSAVATQLVSAVSETNGVITVSRRTLIAADIPSLAINKITNLQTTLDGKVAKFTNSDTADLSTDDGVILAIKNILMKMGMKESNITMP